MVTGVAAGVLNLLPAAARWVPAEPIILILLGMVGTHFVIERYTTIGRIEDKIELLNEIASLGNLPPSQQHAYRRATDAFVKLQHIINRLPPSEAPFAKLSTSFLAPLDEMLQHLSRGEIHVASHQIVEAQDRMCAAFPVRFDAVCERDVEFWDLAQDSEDYCLAQNYLRQHVSVIKRGMAHTRIFIVYLRDLASGRDQLVRVLKRQQRAGIGWAVAIYEELEQHLRTTTGRLDFGLFNGGRALSYFQRENPRQFGATIALKAVPDTEKVLSHQIDIHQQLIAECWLASATFAKTYREIHGGRGNGAIRLLTQRYNAWLQSAIPDVQLEHEAFPLIADSLDSIETKLAQLDTLVKRYRSARGSTSEEGGAA